MSNEHLQVFCSHVHIHRFLKKAVIPRRGRKEEKKENLCNYPIIWFRKNVYGELK